MLIFLQVDDLLLESFEFPPYFQGLYVNCWWLPDDKYKNNQAELDLPLIVL